MTVKLNSLARWSRLDGAEAIVFDGSDVGERRVRIDFNLEGVTAFFIGEPDGSERFLVTIGPGVETLEFSASGAFRVYAEKGSPTVYYRCAEHEQTANEVVDPRIFTKIAQRRHRNPELEEMMYRMQANMERRFAMQADELKAHYERVHKDKDNATAASKTKDAPAVSVGRDSQKVQPQSSAGEGGGETPASPAGSEQQGDAGGGNGGA